MLLKKEKPEFFYGQDKHSIQNKYIKGEIILC